MISVSVLGASGYTGGELLRWLHVHPGVRIAHFGAHTRSGEAIEEVWPHMRSLSSGEFSAPDPRQVAAIDNLVKGAADQAIQNMNLMFGLPETEGLWTAPAFP